jgi:serine/threonine protein kinase
MVVRALQAKPDPDPFDDQQREEVVKLVQAVQKESLEGLSEETSRPLPTHIGQYAILGRLNSGGMGEVYRAQHPQLKRLVALKIMRPHLLTNAQAIKRFQREVEAAGKLSHRHIVTTYDAGEHEGNSYLVMEYIDGSDLSRVVKRHGPLGESLAVACILQAARGLEYAHYRGIIHRDVKPSNLLLDEQGTVKILDMGLARFDDALNDDLTTSEAVLGTIDYMSPEQAASTHAVDARADVYALGCTLWFVLTGRRIYDGDTPMSRMLKHREAPIPSLRAARDDASPALERIYQKMVAKVPEDRYQSMADVVRELELWQANACGLSLPDANEMAMTALSEFAKKLASDEREHCGIAGQASPRPGIGPIRKKSVVGVESLVDTVAGKRLKLPAKVIVLGAALSVVLASAIFMIRDHESDVPGRPESLMGDAVQAAPAHLLAPFTVRQARATQEAWASYFHTKVEQTNTIGMTLVLIPPGEFLMGSTPEQSALGRKMAEDAKIKPDAWEWQRLAEEGPQHRVTLTKPYWLGMTEVTVRQFKRFVEATGYVSEAEQFGFGNSSAKTPDAKVTPEMKTLTWRAPSYAVTDDSPVTQVTWNDAVRKNDSLAIDGTPNRGGYCWLLVSAIDCQRKRNGNMRAAPARPSSSHLVTSRQCSTTTVGLTTTRMVAQGPWA